MRTFCKDQVVSIIMVALCSIWIVSSANAFVAPEDVQQKKGRVEYVNYMEGYIQLGNQYYYFGENQKVQLAEKNIVQSDIVEVLYKKEGKKNKAIRVTIVKKSSKKDLKKKDSK